MKTVKVETNEKIMFRDLDPFAYLETEEMENELILGICEEGEENDTPVGLMICCYDETMLMIRWLFVDPDHRGKGCGDELISAAFKAAENGEISEVGALLTNDEDREQICPDEETYLKFHGFEKQVVLPGDKGRMLIAKV